MRELLANDKIRNSINTLPGDVREAFPQLKLINKEDLWKRLIMKIDDVGNKGYSTFQYMFCKICKQNRFFKFVTSYQADLPNNPTIEDILDKWDHMNSKKDISEYLDLCGCVLPNLPIYFPRYKIFMGQEIFWVCFYGSRHFLGFF